MVNTRFRCWLVTFTRVSAPAVTAEAYHFFTCFRHVSLEGNKCFRKCNFMLTCAETHGNVAKTLIFYISVDVIRPKRSGNTFFSCFR